MGDVDVSLSTVGQGICDPTNTASVTFLTEHGNLPPIRIVRAAPCRAVRLLAGACVRE